MSAQTAFVRGNTYQPFYPANGGPCRGFVCDVCDAVSKTRRGMLLHLQLKHRIVLQEKLPLKPEPAEVPA